MELVVTLAIGLLGGGALATIVVAVLNRRKTAAEAHGLEAASAQSVEGARVERSLATLEAVLVEVRAELASQRLLREGDRKDFNNEIVIWREKSAACDERLAAEIRARKHEHVLARERDIAIADLQRELTLALSDLGRLSKRADEEDRRARDVVAASAAADLLKQAGVDVRVLSKIEDVQAGVDAVGAKVDQVSGQVTTGNDSTLAHLADMAESGRIQKIPEADRTDKEQTHLDEIGEQ